MIPSLQGNIALTFSDSDLPKDGTNHLHPLHITVAVCGKHVPTVLIENGSALNVCPLRVASHLGLGPSDFTPATQIVRAYDNTRREVIGVVTLQITVGPMQCPVEFQVLDVPSY